MTVRPIEIYTNDYCYQRVYGGRGTDNVGFSAINPLYGSV